MRRARLLPALLLALFCFGALPATAEDTAPLRIQGTKSHVLPPRQAPAVQVDTPAPGEWAATWAGGDTTAWFQVRTFPVKSNRDPERVLSLAVDSLVRSMGVSGFGMPIRKRLVVWGRPAADGVFEFVRDGVKRGGRVRLLLDSPHTWVFAVCHGPYKDRLRDLERMKQFVESLEPVAPTFYDVRFDERGRHTEIRLGVERGAPLTLAEVAATEAVLEAGLGYRVPLGDRPLLRQSLLVLPRQEGERGIKAMRDMKRAVDAALEKPAVERMPFLAPLGQRMLEGMRKRVEKNDRSALAVLQVVMRLDQAVAKAEERTLPAAVWRSRLEMAAFLASVLRGEATRMDLKTQSLLEQELSARFAESPDAFRASDRAWARLRYAWDQASSGQKQAARRALAPLLLADPALIAPIVESGDARALYSALETARDGTKSKDVLVRAAWLTKLEPIWKALGTAEGGFHFGW